MKTTLHLFLLVVLLLAFGVTGAQIQASLFGSRLQGLGTNTTSFSGFGARVSYAWRPRMAIGLGARLCPIVSSAGFSTESDFLSGITATTMYDRSSQVFGSFDYLLLPERNAFGPFAGVDMGASINYRRIDGKTITAGTVSTTANTTFAFIAPRIGLKYRIGSRAGLWIQGVYGYTFGKHGNTGPGYFDPTIQKPIDTFVAFDGGLFVDLAFGRN